MAVPRWCACVWGVVLIAGCAAKVVPPPVVPFDAGPPLAAAARQLTVGCLDCLQSARTEYRQVLEQVPGSTEAADGLVRASLLIALRETELGLPSSGALDAAAAAADLTNPVTTVALAVATALTTQPLDTRLVLRLQNEWSAALRPHTPADATASYVWLALACGPYNSQLPDHDDRAALEEAGATVSLIAYKLASACRFRDNAALMALREREPRFLELDYWIGLVGLSGQPQLSGPLGRPDLDLADHRLSSAYAWRNDWPAVTGALAAVALTAEDYARAVEFYDKTIILRPDNVEAMVGKLRSLTYLGRPADAIAVADQILALNRNPGEAYYWRAFNRLRQGELDTAWADVESAAGTLINAAVPKLAGLVAIRRHDLGTARERLQLSITRQPNDCETHFYLQAAWASDGQWREVAATSATAATCLDGEQNRLRDEIARDLTEAPGARRDRVIARKEAELASATRMRATVRFNGAAAHFNLANRAEARRLAEQLTEDEQFGERARSLLDQLGTR